LPSLERAAETIYKHRGSGREWQNGELAPTRRSGNERQNGEN
jgi:hypothetical protein